MEFPALSQERIEKALGELKLDYERDEDGFTSLSFADLVCYFTVRSDHFSAWASWRGEGTTEEDFQALRLVVNEVNQEVRLVRTAIISTPGRYRPVGQTLFPAPQGMTDQQLVAGLDYFFACAHMVASRLNEAVGHLRSNAEGGKQ